VAEGYLRHYTRARGGPKRLNAAAQAWVQGYGWPGITGVSHVMERDLLHLGEELDAESLRQLCLTSQRQKCPVSRPSTLDPAPEVALRQKRSRFGRRSCITEAM